MSNDMTFTDAEEGKTVRDQSGNEIGRIVKVEGGVAHVDPDPGITDTVMSKLGWGDRHEGTYEIEPSAVDSVTDDEVRLGKL
jgi:hypothetical protein